MAPTAAPCPVLAERDREPSGRRSAADCRPSSARWSTRSRRGRRGRRGRIAVVEVGRGRRGRNRRVLQCPAISRRALEAIVWSETSRNHEVFSRRPPCGRRPGRWPPGRLARVPLLSVLQACDSDEGPSSLPSCTTAPALRRWRAYRASAASEPRRTAWPLTAAPQALIHPRRGQPEAQRRGGSPTSAARREVLHISAQAQPDRPRTTKSVQQG